MHTAASVASPAVGTVFSIAAILKVASLNEFRSYLSSLGLRGKETRLAAPIIICVELLIGCALVLQWQSSEASLAALVVSLGFVGVQLSQLRKRGATSCSCFGVLDRDEVDSVAFVRAILLSAVAFVAWSNSGTVITVGAELAGALLGLVVVLGGGLLSAAIAFERGRARPVPIG